MEHAYHTYLRFPRSLREKHLADSCIRMLEHTTDTEQETAKCALKMKCCDSKA